MAQNVLGSSEPGRQSKHAVTNGSPQALFAPFVALGTEKIIGYRIDETKDGRERDLTDEENHREYPKRSTETSIVFVYFLRTTRKCVHTSKTLFFAYQLARFLTSHRRIRRIVDHLR